MQHKPMDPTAAANEAIYHHQLPTQRAVRFVVSRSRIDREKALVAITEALTGYKKKA